MPVPVSSTVSVNTPSLHWVVSVMVPLSVNLMALESRLPPMLKIRFLSPFTTLLAWLRTIKVRCFEFACMANSVSSVSAIKLSLKGLDRIVTFLLSSLK